MKNIDRYILDEAGNPVPCENLMTWARWYENSAAARKVENSTVGRVRISTVFLGLDYNFGEGDRPILYETMVSDNGEESFCCRYSTREEAIAGHDKTVNETRARFRPKTQKHVSEL